MANGENVLCLQAGVELEEYLVDGVLGKGGFAITYSAVDQRLNKRVAIKELLPDGIATRADGNTVMAQTESLLADYEWAIESFIKEAQTIASFEHPNIVRVLRFFRKNGTAYMVMPFIEGEDLKRIMKARGRFSYPDLLRILQPLLAGLSVVHADNVLHRDIKPENIYVTTYGVPILIDFGAARQQVGGKSLDVTSIITPGYAPIEQYSTDAKYQGPWSDIYSMAACVYHMITGVKPVPASERSDASRNNQPDPLTPLTQLQPEGYPPQFLAGIDKALQMGEMQRPQSVDTWLTLLGLTDTSAGSTTVVSGPMTGHSGGAQGPQSPRPPGKSGGRKTGVIIAAALVMVALLLGGGFLVVSQLQNNQNKGKGKVRSTAQADQDKPVEKPKEVAQEPKGNDYQPLLTELEVAIKVGEYDKAKDMIRDLDRKDLTQPQRIKLADLRDLREKEMRNCPASLYFRPSPAAVTVDIDGIRGYLASGRYELRGVGKHTVKISASGYEAMEKTVEVASKGQMIDLGTVTLNEDASARLARERIAAEQERKRRMEQEEKDRLAAQNKEADLKRELIAFVNDYYRRLASNDVDVVGGLYDSYVDYEYIKGRKASRDEVKTSFSANIKRWPVRAYNPHEKTSYKLLNEEGTRAILYFGYDYNYSNYSGKKAKGSAYDTVTIEKKYGTWKIIKWEQGVKRTRNDLNGL